MTSHQVKTRSGAVDRLLTLIDDGLAEAAAVQLPADVMAKIERYGSIAAMPVEYA